MRVDKKNPAKSRLWPLEAIAKQAASQLPRQRAETPPRGKLPDINSYREPVTICDRFRADRFDSITA
jgi:hypothetical protein